MSRLQLESACLQGRYAPYIQLMTSGLPSSRIACGEKRREEAHLSHSRAAPAETSNEHREVMYVPEDCKLAAQGGLWGPHVQTETLAGAGGFIQDYDL